MHRLVPPSLGAAALALAMFACSSSGAAPGGSSTSKDGGVVGSAADGESGVDAAIARDAASTKDGGGDAATTVPHDKLLFVTSASYRGTLATLPGAGGVLERGDALCNGTAKAAGLPGSFRVWLSTNTTNAIDHIRGDGPWHRTTDKKVVFPNKAKMIADGTMNDINGDEFGVLTENASAWTGTDSYGILAKYGVGTPDNCGNWTLGDDPFDSSRGSIGRPSGGISYAWSEFSFSSCSSAQSLYCFEE